MGHSQSDTLQRPGWIQMLKRENMSVKDPGYTTNIHLFEKKKIFNMVEFYTFAASGVVYMIVVHGTAECPSL